MKHIYLSFLFVVAVLFSQAQTLLPEIPETDGAVHCMTQLGDSLYIGGAFSRLYFSDSSSRYGAAIDTSVSVRGAYGKWAKPNGSVNISVPDGYKGYYIGGSFTQVGDSARKFLAHIDSTGKVTSKLAKASVNANISTMALLNDTLYIGGEFTGTMDSVVVGTSGAAIEMNGSIDFNFPKVNGIIRASIADGNGGWYIGGEFTTVGDSLRYRLAHIDSLGNVSNWKPIAGIVRALALSGDTLYVGGTFNSIGGQARNNIAALDAVTGSVRAWNPGANGTAVYALAVSNNLIYVGGSFTTIGGQSRNRIA